MRKSEYTFLPGTFFAPHNHDAGKYLKVISGKVRIGIGTKNPNDRLTHHHLSEGQGIIIPADVYHDTETKEGAVVQETINPTCAKAN